jgi:plastocyanin
METKSPRFLGARRSSGGWLLRRAAVALALMVVPGAALAATITVKGRTVGANKLQNPVWNEASAPKLHRYTFREPSPTVRADVRTLTAHLPKELCIAALVPGEGKAKQPYRVVIAGGRTSPVTLVVASGQQIQFENGDPFPHRIYVVGADPKGLPPVDMAQAKTRAWTPPGPGKYEIRDQLAPSVRSWIVVEPHVVNVGYPDRKGDFQIDLEPGDYTLRGYFNGDAVGVELPIKVTPAPVKQPLRAPLVVGESDAPPAPSGAPSAGKPGPKKAGGG